MTSSPPLSLRTVPSTKTSVLPARTTSPRQRNTEPVAGRRNVTLLSTVMTSLSAGTCRAADGVIGDRHNNSGVNETMLLLELGAHDDLCLAPARTESDELDPERLHEFCVRKDRFYICH